MTVKREVDKKLEVETGEGWSSASWKSPREPFQKSALSPSRAASHFALSCVSNSPHTPVEMLQHYHLENNEERPFESATTGATKQTRREDTKSH
jgi:hypothetical protein